MAEREAITGVVRHIIAERANRDGGKWIAARLKTATDENVSFTVTGDFAVGDDITVYGKWEQNAKYGKQFKGSACSISLPVDAAGLARWLEKNVFSVGPVAARRLLDRFGTELPTLCLNEPERVASDGEVSAEVVQAIGVAWQKNGTKLAALTWLIGKAGLTDKQANAAVKKFGETVVKTIQDDPFQLLGNVEGFGWKTVDDLANRMGISGTDRRRIRGALVAAVRESEAEKGCTCISVDRAIETAARKITDATAKMFETAVEDATARGDVVFVNGALALRDCLRNEDRIWDNLARSREPNPLFPHSELAAAAYAEQFRVFDAERNFQFDDQQMEAVANAFRYRISVITGGAGAGKTAITNAIIRAFEELEVTVHLAAPTGKAARRMTELTGHGAQTIHRLLGFNGGTMQFTINQLQPLPDGVVIVDETSMLDSALAARLFAGLPRNAAVVFVGDANQLPPVGAGAFLRDVLEHDLAPATRLLNCHRQAGALKANSVGILTGKVATNVPATHEGVAPPWCVEAHADTPEKVREAVHALYATDLPNWKLDPIRDAQFMSAQKSGPLGTRSLNLILQHLHQNAIGNEIPAPPMGTGEVGERPEIYVGDKVIQTRNNYQLNVMNGEIGIVTALNVRLDDLYERFAAPDADEFLPYSPETHLVTPIMVDAEGVRRCLCPVCAAARVVTAEGGWVTQSCVPCGAVFVATDGTVTGQAPPPRPRRAPPPTISHVVQFPDRPVAFPIGEGGDLELAYCLTTHKMQGSQVRCAITIVPKNHQFMQTRNWLYTAVTRAELSSVIVGDRLGILGAASKMNADDRDTLLRLYAITGKPEKETPPTPPLAPAKPEEGTFSLTEQWP